MTDLTTKKMTVSDGNSSIVIVRLLGDIPGGVTLDTSLTPGLSVIKAGHVVLVKDGKYFAAPVTGNAYAAFGDKSPIGVINADVLATGSLASVLTIGQVRASAAPYPYTDVVKKALPQIQFI